VDTDNAEPKQADKNEEQCLSRTKHDSAIDTQAQPIALFPELNAGLFCDAAGSRLGEDPWIHFFFPQRSVRRRGHGSESHRIDRALDRFQRWSKVCTACKLDLMAAGHSAHGQRHHRKSGEVPEFKFEALCGHVTGMPDV
jgi:hypothetical protein